MQHNLSVEKYLCCRMQIAAETFACSSPRKHFKMINARCQCVLVACDWHGSEGQFVTDVYLCAR